MWTVHLIELPFPAPLFLEVYCQEFVAVAELTNMGKNPFFPIGCILPLRSICEILCKARLCPSAGVLYRIAKGRKFHFGEKLQR